MCAFHILRVHAELGDGNFRDPEISGQQRLVSARSYQQGYHLSPCTGASACIIHKAAMVELQTRCKFCGCFD
jgi:hypothetical protein